MDALAQDWCRMWNDDPALAHQLVTAGFRMWLGRSTGGDQVRGPADLAAFVTAYRAEQGVRFTPLVVAAGDGGRLAYTWEAVFPDGATLGGIDVCTMHGGLVAENWSIAGERPNTLPGSAAGAGSGRRAVRAERMRQLCADWSPMWNGEVSLAAELVSGDFRIWFGGIQTAADDLAGPGALADYVTKHRAGRPSLTFAKHRDLVIDAARQRAAFTWSARVSLPDGGQREVAGIDLFTFAADRIDRAWSVTGARPFAF
ncbi:MAG: hypothetical protein ACLQDY_19960 [Streptosporangiaceae bacterium]